MAFQIDDLDRKILRELQSNNLQSLDELAKKLGSSKTPIWNRIRKMREQGVITKDVSIVDPQKLGIESCFFVLVRTSEHEKSWQDRFLSVLKQRDEVMEAHRLAGDIDYLVKVRVQNSKAYDVFYQALIKEVKIFNVTALLSMEEIKNTTQLPI